MSDDSKIIDMFFARDEGAISELSDKYGAACKRLSVNILKNELDADECVNDTYLAAWNSIPPAKPNPLKTFILRITRNISIARYHANTALKRNSHYDTALEELEDCLSDTDTVKDELEARELAKLFDSFLDSLDRDSRVMFMCRYWCSESIGDIAEKFGKTDHAVTVRLSRIRERLKKYLTEKGVTL